MREISRICGGWFVIVVFSRQVKWRPNSNLSKGQSTVTSGVCDLEEVTPGRMAEVTVMLDKLRGGTAD